MASENTANELPANTTVSFAGDVLAARIAPLVFAAMVALIGMLTITGVFSDFRDAIQNSPSNDDAGFYEFVYEQYGAATWDDCFSGPLEDFMPAAIDTSKATVPTLDEPATSGGNATEEAPSSTDPTGAASADEAPADETPAE